MKIVSHRGFWLVPAEKNTEAAFQRALDRGFGIETDLRDALGTLVIAHDPPRGGELTAARLAELCRTHPGSGPLALNVKADGLQGLVRDALDRDLPVGSYFFDMSVPDTLGYLAARLPIYTRHSELEPVPALYDQAVGVWMDAFHGDWIHGPAVTAHLDAGKEVCLVSPELHGRPYRPFWERLRSEGLGERPGCAICTDHPDEAAEFFR
jgi:glycerophosphoryl diester phosphodiesterase